jgi:hypothetical protein
MPQGFRDTVIALRAIFLGHTHHRGLQLLFNLGSSKSAPALESVKPLRDELAVQGENGVGLHDCGDFLQSLFSLPVV